MVSVPFNKGAFFKDKFLKSLLISVGWKGLSELNSYILKQGVNHIHILSSFSTSDHIILNFVMNNIACVAEFEITDIPKPGRTVGAAVMDFEYTLKDVHL